MKEYRRKEKSSTNDVSGFVVENREGGFYTLRCKQCGNVFKEPVGNTCRDCRHYAEFVSVCTNGESEHRADFVGEDGICEKWEEVQE